MIKKIALCGVFSSLAIAISALEYLIPIQSIVPLPGIKLGLSNIIVLFLLLKTDFTTSFFVMVGKCLMTSLMFSGLGSFIYSITGGVLSLAIMYLLLRYKKTFSLIGVSIAGAAMHNIGQIISASVMLGSFYIFKYLPILLFVSFFTGALTAIISNILNNRIKYR